MSIVNTSLSNNSDFAALINDNHLDERGPVTWAVVPNDTESNRPDSSSRHSEDKSNIAMQPPRPISVVTVGDSGSRATAALSEEVQPSVLTTAINQMTPQTPVRSCHSELGSTSVAKKQKARNGQASG